MTLYAALLAAFVVGALLGRHTRPVTPWVATKYVSDVTAEWRQAHGLRVPIYARRED